MAQIHVSRRERLTGRLPAFNAGAVLITKPIHLRYLTGLASSNAALLVYTDGRAALATDSRYAEIARTTGLEVVEDRQVNKVLMERAAGLRLGFEDHHLTVAQRATMDGPELVPVGRLVEDLRQVKDESEIALLRRACEITDRAFADVVERIRPGLTESEIARALEIRMIELGAKRPGFDSIVASGPNGAIPHHEPTDRTIRRGDLVTMDFGAQYQGYHADMTRTVAVGTPSGWQRELYELVAAAQAKGCEAVRPGASIGEVDAAAREVIADAGHREHFEHGLGHGVGLEIHEAPFLSPNRPGTLEDRVPITIEPGVYVSGKGGVRIEDTVVVRSDGPEMLTLTTKELLVL